MKINYFDIHSHLESSKFDGDRKEVISRMKDEGVFTITVGTDLENSKKAVQIASYHKNVFASIGLHPNDTGHYPQNSFQKKLLNFTYDFKKKFGLYSGISKIFSFCLGRNLKAFLLKAIFGIAPEDFQEEDYSEMVKNSKVVAIGECGLEFFRLGENEEVEIEKQRQIDIFQKQIDFAVKYDKPLMIHVRDAHTEVLNILDQKKKEHREKLRGNIHFFSGDADIAKRYLDLGFTMSFTGVITFTNDYDEVIKYIPLNKLMSETDSPFVAPVPYRGKRCEPLYVKEIVKRIAEIKELDEEVVKKAMMGNATRFFGIKNLN